MLTSEVDSSDEEPSDGISHENEGLQEFMQLLFKNVVKNGRALTELQAVAVIAMFTVTPQVAHHQSRVVLQRGEK